MFDVVIIGSGLGGLLSAVILAKEGMKVCIVEKNRQIGGCLQTFAFRKKVFDSCVHYIGGLGEGHTLNRIFQYAGIMDKLTLKELDRSGFDQIAFGEETELYPHACRSEQFVAQLLPHFPREKAALEQYLKTMREVTDSFPLYQLRQGEASEKAGVSGLELEETLARITPNKRLQQVLAGNNLLYAGVPGKTPFYLHALVTESYLHSAHKVVPGSSQIAKFLWQELQRHGGEIIRNHAAAKLVAENGVLKYAQTAGGEHIPGRNFIAALHPEAALQLIDSKLIRPVYRQRIHSLEQTPSALMLNIVLKTGTIVHRNHNVYWHPDGRVFPEQLAGTLHWPGTQAFYFTEDRNQPGYSDTLTILCYGEYKDFQRWMETSQTAGVGHLRNSEYEAEKSRISEALLTKATRFLPELSGAVQDCVLATPLTYRDYTGAPEGGMYGILKDVNQPAKTTIAVRTKIPNLFFTGQNVNLHGVLGVSITAIATCAELLGMDHLLRRIHSV